MNCPHCGHMQPAGQSAVECAHCGIVFQKFLARHPDTPLQPDSTSESVSHPLSEPGSSSDSNSVSYPPPTLSSTRPVDVLDQPVGRFAQTIRILAGLVLVAIAVLMYANGSVFKAFYPYAITLFFGASGLWLLVTTFPRVKIRQFAMEMFVLVTISLILRTSYPEIFTLDTNTSAPMSESTAKQTSTSASRYDAFVNSVVSFQSSVEALLNEQAQPDPKNTEKVPLGDEYRAVVADYRNLPTRDRERAFTTYVAARDLNEAIRSGLRSNSASGSGARTLATNVRQTISGKLDELKSSLTRMSDAEPPSTQ